MISQRVNSLFKILRSGVAAADTALATFDNDSFPTSNIWTRGLDDLSAMLAFFGEGDENGTVVGKVYGKGKNGPIRRIADVTLTLGTQAVTKHPITRAAEATAVWFDTITVSNETLSIEGALTSGNNEVAQMSFDLTGIESIYFEITSLTNVTAFNAIIRGDNA